MLNYRLVDFKNKNLKLILNWRNQNDIRKNSINKKKIKFEEHRSWVKDKIKKKIIRFLFFIKEKSQLECVL